MAVETTIGEFKGHKLLELHAEWERDDMPAMTFGLRKAQLLLEAIPAIARFVHDNNGEVPKDVTNMLGWLSDRQQKDDDGGNDLPF